MQTTAQPPLPDDASVDVGVIGGSGFYSLLDDVTHHRVTTPFGEPSDEIAVGEVQGRRVAFLPRHGRQHQLPPHRVPYRANLCALRALGARQVVSACAVGSLVPERQPGDLVVVDQVIDRTWGRPHTIYGEPGPVVHVGFADPFCPNGRRAAVDAGHRSSLATADHGTLVVVNGPRFSSRAESQWHRAAGGTVVGMTAMPEAAIARELAMCFTTCCLVTDMDAGVEGETGVTHAEVIAAFAGRVEQLKQVVVDTVQALPAAEPDDTAACVCRRSLDGIRLPFELP